MPRLSVQPEPESSAAQPGISAHDLLATVSRFPLKPGQAAAILESTLVEYKAKLPYLSQPDVWLTATVRRRCLQAVRANSAETPAKSAPGLQPATSKATVTV